MNHLGIFINNTNSEIKLNVSLNNFQKLKKNFTDIIIYDNDTSLSNDLKNKITENNTIHKYILNNNGQSDNSDFNLDKLFSVLSVVKTNYHYITVINDNYIYIDSLEEYFYYIFRHNLDFYSYTDSSEFFYHYQLNLFSFKGYMIENILNYIKKYDKNNVKNNILKDFINVFDLKMPFIKTAFIDCNYERNVHYNDKYVEFLLKNKNLKILNIDYINKLRKTNKKTVYVAIPDYFDINIYRNHNDLVSFDNNFLIDHFLNNGQYEVRDYRINNFLLPPYIREFLQKCNNLIEHFDVPNDFSLYNYIEKNKELQSMGYYDLMNHYVDIGKKEGKMY